MLELPLDVPLRVGVAVATRLRVPVPAGVPLRVLLLLGRVDLLTVA